jgi:uncharacterized damage-inducible protein DinB
METSMQKDEVIALFHYNQWANLRILESAALCTPLQFTQSVACSFGSLRGTLAHTYSAEWVWRNRILNGISPSTLIDERSFPDLSTLRQAWDNEMRTMLGFLAALSPEKFAEGIKYRSTKGEEFVTPLWQILAHLVNHGTQFRSEAGMLLSAWGYSPGDLDMIFYFRRK